MKKFYLVSVCVVLSFLFLLDNAVAGGAVKLGIDFNLDHELEAYGETASIDVEPGLSFAAEFFQNVHNNIDLGAGLLFQLPKEAEFQGITGEFMFMPVYALLRVKGSSGQMTPYGTLQLGYNFLYANDAYQYPGSVNGGLYYGVGGGLLIDNRYLIEVLYSTNYGEWEHSGASADITNTQFTISFGVQF